MALTLSAAERAALDSLTSQVAETTGLTSQGLLAKHALPADPGLGYDPATALGLDLIQHSTLPLDPDERALLQQHGFVVSARKLFPTMLSAYESLYVQDLPLYVSADSILDSVHRSYDALLESVELSTLRPELNKLLLGMRAALQTRATVDQASRDADFYLGVALGLLQGSNVSPTLGSDPAVAVFVQAAQAGTGQGQRELFGRARTIDWSQFDPRGHYAKSPELSAYFRAMMWLGRIDLRLLETQPDGSTVFYRRQLEAMFLLRSLLDDAALARFTRIDNTLAAFVGQSDTMRLPEVDALRKDLGLVDDAGLAGLSDETLAQTILSRGYGAQRIASQIIIKQDFAAPTLPLDRSFALFGQRYTVDSHVFSNLVYDRIPSARMLPNPLDVAFAALANDAAAPVLQPELDQYAYAPALESVRTLIDAHGADYWNQNLYTGWLGSLRALSAQADPALPSVAHSQVWSHRILGTQLASWAQLRHDTVLYAKQSYTSGVACEYPDAYVEPYPAFFDALATFAARGSVLAEQLAGGTSTEQVAPVRAYFDHLASAMTTLGGMARAERSGAPFDAQQLAFINEAVHKKQPFGCGGPPVYDGWFAKLHFGADDTGSISAELEPTIADVHTQPTEPGGADIGRILHVATGVPRLLVVTVDSCQGPRAYAGPAFAYHEVTTEHWKRLTDEQWAEQLNSQPKQPEVPWADYVAPQ